MRRSAKLSALRGNIAAGHPDCADFFCMPAETRKAHAVNERSMHAPQTVAQYKASHGPGCGCCSSGKTVKDKGASDKKKPARLVTKTRSGAKGFPTARPWMISH
ncbi:hypothetical protein ACVWYH_003967 [Bradyrhizobium sp. GM24.11]